MTIIPEPFSRRNIAVLFILSLFSVLLVRASQAEEAFREVDVTEAFDEGQGSKQCDTGTMVWDGRKLRMHNPGNGNCMVPISIGKLENFRATAKVNASDGNASSAGIYFGNLNGTAAVPGSIFFTRMNTFGARTFEASQVQENAATSGSIFSIFASGPPEDVFHLEMTKVDRQFRFFVNGNMVADWNDTVARKEKVWLILSSFGGVSQGVFQDFKVYKLEASGGGETGSGNKPKDFPTREDKPPLDRNTLEDEWDDL